jgi:hypothetical protein
MSINTKTFLEAIFKNEKIYFRRIKGKIARNFPKSYYYDEIENELRKYNEQGYNIYFTVNSGGTKKNQINKINAFFIDCDCGRDDNDNYFDLETVKQYKEKKLQRVQEFELQPSFIVDTRNGYHIYWLVDNAKVENFEEAQKKLIYYFKSDERAFTLQFIMRLPGYYWTKYIDNQYLCTVYQHNDVRYNADDFIQHLNSKVPDFVPEKKNISTKTTISKPCSIDNSNEHIDAIRRLDVQKLKRLINIDDTKKINVKSKTELKHIIYTKISINDFLGVPDGMFRCVVHKDENPSANIAMTSDGLYNYYCFGCGFSGSIVKLMEEIANCNKVEAIKFIQKVYNIEVVETDRQKKIKEILEENIEYIMSKVFELEYPEIYKIIYRYIPELVCLHELAIQNINNDLIIDDQSIFFASISYIAKCLHYSNFKRITDRVNLFAFLGLIEKIDKKDIPINYLQEAEKFKHGRYITSYYSIPSYCYSKMKNITEKAKLYKQKNMTMKGFSRELLVRSLSQDEANKVYVQQKDEKLSKASEQFTNKATKTILNLIQQQGYCTEEQIIKQIRGKKEEKKTKLKRCLQEILENHNLKRVKANKELKQKYNIKSKGYPFVIISAKI